MREGKWKKVLVLFGTMFISLLGMTAPSAWAQNPTPSIDDLKPVSAHLDALAFTLTVRGTGFTLGAVVYWQVAATATSLATTFVTATELTARVPASLLKRQATAQITVRNVIFHRIKVFPMRSFLGDRTISHSGIQSNR
jgi:hypothetical protein